MRPNLLRAAPLAGLAAILILAACQATPSDSPSASHSMSPDDSMSPSASGMIDPGVEADVTVEISADGFMVITTDPAASEEPDTSAAPAANQLMLDVGQTVEFRNTDTVDQTVTHGRDGVGIGEDGDSSENQAFDLLIPAGTSMAYTFAEPGTYDVTSRANPEANLTVVVSE